MKRIFYLLSFSILLASCNNSGPNVDIKTAKNEVDSLCYSIGVYEAYDILNKVYGSGIDKPSFDYLIAGLSHVLNSDTAKTKHDQQWALDNIQNYFIEKSFKENTNAGVEFLEKNKDKDSIAVMTSGLQYKIVTEGTGKSPKLTDTIEVKYTGKLITGQTFDSSGDMAIKMPLNQMIEGWQQVLPLMKEGAKYTLFVPSALGYGKRPAGSIPPGSTLIFDVELVGVTDGN